MRVNAIAPEPPTTNLAHGPTDSLSLLQNVLAASTEYSVIATGLVGGIGQALAVPARRC